MIYPRPEWLDRSVLAVCSHVCLVAPNNPTQVCEIEKMRSAVHRRRHRGQPLTPKCCWTQAFILPSLPLPSEIRQSARAFCICLTGGRSQHQTALGLVRRCTRVARAVALLSGIVSTVWPTSRPDYTLPTKGAVSCNLDNEYSKLRGTFHSLLTALVIVVSFVAVELVGLDIHYNYLGTISETGRNGDITPLRRTTIRPLPGVLRGGIPRPN
jgi:hypothetical protein